MTLGFALGLALISAVSTLVFAAGGTVIALAVRGYTATMSRLYMFDLVGAALGAIVVVPLMWQVGVPILIVAIGPIGAVAALLFLGGIRGATGRAALSVLGLGLVAVVLASTTTVFSPAAAETAALGQPPRTLGPPSAAWSRTTPPQAASSSPCFTTVAARRSRHTGVAHRSRRGGSAASAANRSATSSAVPSGR